MKIFKYVGIIVYSIIVLLSTFCLFTFNEFSNSVIGNITVIGLKSKIEDFSRGSLILVKKDIENVKNGDEIIFYNTENGKNVVDTVKVIKVMKTNDKEYTYVIDNDLYLSSEYLIGNVNDVKCVPMIGYIYIIFTSKVGYFTLIILPIIIMFVLFVKRYKNEN